MIIRPYGGADCGEPAVTELLLVAGPPTAAWGASEEGLAWCEGSKTFCRSEPFYENGNRSAFIEMKNIFSIKGVCHG